MKYNERQDKPRFITFWRDDIQTRLHRDLLYIIFTIGVYGVKRVIKFYREDVQVPEYFEAKIKNISYVYYAY